MSSICDIPGIRVGHAQNFEAQTGCTVILPDKEAVAGIDVRGSAPGTRELELLKPVRLVEKVNAVLLAGGSAFGLDAAGGVQQFLEERNIGYDTGIARIPLVPTAVIFDLGVGNASIRPDKEMGYIACENALTSNVTQGRIGVGCGATVGKCAGHENASPGGIGTCSEFLPNGAIVGVLTVVNSLGEVFDPHNGNTLAGPRNPSESGFLDSLDLLKNMSESTGFKTQNTTLSVVATNAALTRESATKVAQMAQDGLARVIRPAHTMFDGDIVFALSVGTVTAETTLIGSVACELVAESIVRAVQATLTDGRVE